MAYELPILIHSFPTAANLSAKQFYAVSLVGDAAVLADADSGEVGILQNKPDGTQDGGATAGAMVAGISRAVAGEAIAAMSRVKAGSDGRLVACSEGGIGLAILAAAQAGDIFSILIGGGGGGSGAEANQAVAAAGAVDLDSKDVDVVGPATGTYAITLAAPTDKQAGTVKVIAMSATTSTNAVTLALTNVVGGSAGSSASFNAAGEVLVLVGAPSIGKWIVLVEVGVTLS